MEPPEEVEIVEDEGMTTTRRMRRRQLNGVVMAVGKGGNERDLLLREQWYARKANTEKRAFGYGIYTKSLVLC